MMFTLSRNEAWGHSCVHTPWVSIGVRHRQCWALCPAAHRPREISRSQNKALAQQRGSEPRIPSSTPYPIPTPTQATQGLCPLGASWKLKSQIGDNTGQVELLLGTPSEDRKIHQISSKAGCSELKCLPHKTLPRPQNFAQADSGHTCGIQKFLVHTVREAAEQAMGPHHTLLQILSGDGVIRIPLFHLTAGSKRQPLKGCREPPRSYSMHS